MRDLSGEKLRLIVPETARLCRRFTELVDMIGPAAVYVDADILDGLRQNLDTLAAAVRDSI